MVGGVIRQLFEPALAHEPDAEKLLAGAAALVRPVLAVRAAGPSPAGGSHRLEALHGLYWLTVNLTAAAPVLVGHSYPSGSPHPGRSSGRISAPRSIGGVTNSAPFALHSS
jgi:hypothetical protein